MRSLICVSCSSDQRFARGLVGSPHPASFRFAVACNTLAFGYILPTTGRIWDFHPLETCAARRTHLKNGDHVTMITVFYFVITTLFHNSHHVRNMRETIFLHIRLDTVNDFQRCCRVMEIRS